MKIQKKKNNKSLVLAGTLVLLALLGGYTAFAAYSHNWPFNTTPVQNQSTDNSSDTTSDTPSDKPGASDELPSTPTDPDDKIPVQNDTPDSSSPEDKNILTGVINYKSVSDGKLTIRTTIDQRITSGTCILTLTRNSPKKTVTKSAEVLANPSSSTCKGFDVPTSELGTGSWNILITITSGDKKGEITGQISI